MMRLCPSLILFALICTFTVDAQEKNPLLQSGILISQGSQLYDSGQYKKALAVYQSIDFNDTNYIRALYGISLCYSADSQFNESINYCKKALALNSDPSQEPDLYNQYGNALDAAGEKEKALKIYDSALEKYPAYAFLYLNKGNVLMKQHQYKEAEAVLQKGLLINPYTASTHFKLGLCALNQGKLIPAFFSFIGYLLIAPDGKFHNNCINLLSAISKNEDEIQAFVNDRKETPGEQYQMLEQILQSKIALDNNYKPIIHLDDKISRQIQVIFEKIQYQDSDPDFWMQYYVPYFKSVFADNQFEYFINEIFSGVNLPVIRDYNKKYKKEIGILTDNAATYFSLIRSTRELHFEKRNKDSLIWSYSHGELTGKGKYVYKEDKLVGPWEFYYSPGNIKGRGAYNEQGERIGPFIYYHFNGKMKGKELYQDGKQQGEETYYFSNGVMSSHSWYKNGQPEGESVSYYLVGTPNVITHYLAGKKDGLKIIYFPNGDTSVMEYYTANLLSGEYKSWHQDKSLDIVTQYVNDKLDGQYKKYYPGGQLNTEGMYKAGKQEGPWKFYHANGQLKYEINFVNDKQEGDYKEYAENGQVITTYSFKKGKVNGEGRYYDEDGKLFAIYQYDNDAALKAQFFDKAGKMLGESNRKSKTIDLTTYLPGGPKRMQASYSENGNIHGKQTFFYPSGNVNETNEYQDGREEGPSIGYYPNGLKKSETMYAAGKMDGYHRSFYNHGQVQEEGWYRDNSAQGYWLAYNELGSITDSVYYLNGNVNGHKESYTPNGKKEFEVKYSGGWLEECVQFDSTGKELQHLRFPEGTGNYLLVYPDSKTYLKANYLHGQLTGPRTFYYCNGKLLAQEYYESGMADSVYKTYFHTGIVNIEGQYQNSVKSGIWKYHYPDGKIRSIEEYTDGKLNGRQITYYENGKPEVETAYKEDEKNGLCKRFDPDGTLLYQLTFKKGKLTGYTYLDKKGDPLPEMAIDGETVKVKALFPNGNVSAEFEYKDGYLNGPDKLYYTNGKLRARYELNYGILEGGYIVYHSNGQVKGEYHYLHDNPHGPYKEYNEKGIVIEEGNYYSGSPHGTTRLFDDKGNPKETDFYYYGKLLSIKDETSH